MERKNCCRIILEQIEKIQSDAEETLKELKKGKIKAKSAAYMVLIVNSWKLLPSKCDNCKDRETFMLATIEKIENDRRAQAKIL